MKEINEICKEKEKIPKTLTKKIITIIGLIAIIGLIIYLVFLYNIIIPTIYDQFF